MKEYIIQLSFIRKSVLISEHIDRIKEAINHANRGLKRKHDVCIYKTTSDASVNVLTLYVEAPITMEIQNARIFKAIGTYLIHGFSDIYVPLKQGTRLFQYEIIGETYDGRLVG